MPEPAICAAASIDNCPRYWPISVFELRAPPRLYYPNLTHVLIAVGLTTTFVLAIVLLRRIHYPWYLVTTLGFIVMASGIMLIGTVAFFVTGVLTVEDLGEHGAPPAQVFRSSSTA